MFGMGGDAFNSGAGAARGPRPGSSPGNGARPDFSQFNGIYYQIPYLICFLTVFCFLYAIFCY